MPSWNQLQVDVGIVDDIQYGNPKAPRFVYWDKKLRPTPSGPDVLTFDLLSIGGKLRAGLGLLGFRPKMPGWLHACPIITIYKSKFCAQFAVLPGLAGHGVNTWVSKESLK